MKVKRIQLPLFWKFSIAIASTVILFGSLNLLFIRNQVYKTFENQIEKHGISIALSIAERAVEPILYDDLSALNKLLVQTKNVNGDVKYIFIIDNEKQLIAHTFSNYIPKGIIEVNHIAQGMVKNVLILESENKSENVRDIAIPILDGQLGFVRVGMCEGAFLNEIRSITQLFLIMVFFFLLLGLIAALLLSYIITSPLKAISSYASKVDFNSINHEVKSKFDLNDELSVRLKNLFSLTDEIDILGVTFNDMISRLHTAYKELKNTQESLSQTEKMASVGTLTAGLAHEINNPLAGIRNCIRRIEDKPENIRQNAEYIAMMSEALEKIEKVVEGMLNFSRKQELLFTEADINVLFNNSLNLVNYQLQQSKITLTNLLGDEPVLVNASPNHLEQVFVNVLLNSIDAINERKQQEPNLIGSLTIKSKESNSGVTIEISDNGVGVPPDKVISIFDPFFTFKKIKQGTGLGLAVSYNIINSHNGTISGWNEPTGGFTITIYLPKTVR
jgi:two-component system, NtrC family, sensor kinase